MFRALSARCLSATSRSVCVMSFKQRSLLDVSKSFHSYHSYFKPKKEEKEQKGILKQNKEMVSKQSEREKEKEKEKKGNKEQNNREKEKEKEKEKETSSLSFWTQVAAVGVVGYCILSIKNDWDLNKEWQAMDLRIEELEKKDQCKIMIILDERFKVSRKNVMAFNDVAVFTQWMKNIYSAHEEKKKKAIEANENQSERKNEKIDDLKLLLDSAGGAVQAGSIYLKLLREYPGSKEAYIPNMAASGATILAFATDKWHMNPSAFFTPFDPLITLELLEKSNRYFSARVYREALDLKPKLQYLDALRATEARKMEEAQLKQAALLKNGTNDALIDLLSKGNIPHSTPFTVQELHDHNVPADTNVPSEYNQLVQDVMNLAARTQRDIWALWAEQYIPK